MRKQGGSNERESDRASRWEAWLSFSESAVAATFARAAGDPGELASEVVQKLLAAQKEDLDPNSARDRGYVARAVRNAAIDSIRREKARRDAEKRFSERSGNGEALLEGNAELLCELHRARERWLGELGKSRNYGRAADLIASGLLEGTPHAVIVREAKTVSGVKLSETGLRALVSRTMKRFPELEPWLRRQARSRRLALKESKPAEVATSNGPSRGDCLELPCDACGGPGYLARALPPATWKKGYPQPASVAEAAVGAWRIEVRCRLHARQWKWWPQPRTQGDG